MTMEPTYTSRGFKRFDEVPSAYGGGVEVYESSAAMHPHLWVKVRSPKSVNDWMVADQTGGTYDDWEEATAHLRLEDAVVLRDQLTYLIEHHYQNE